MSPNLEPHHSLPARPPPSSHPTPLRPNNQPAHVYPNTSSYGAFTPRSVVSRAPARHMSAGPTHAPMMTSQAPYSAGGFQPGPYPSSNAYYQQQQPAYGTATPPAMANPYPVPGAAPRGFGRTGTYDPEEEAQIAEWSAAYTPKEDPNSRRAGNPNTTALGVRPIEIPAVPDVSAGPASGADKGKQKTVIREGGGKQWEDASLLEWDPMHPRLFVGNLAGEVTDDSLLKAFSKYPSVSKARVVRDKKTTKSKSYGFVSFANTDDFFRAAKEMEGKYIGSHPVRIKRANTEITATTKRDDKHGKHGKNNKNNKKPGANQSVIQGAPTYYNTNGVQKSSNKKNGGPRVLG